MATLIGVVSQVVGEVYAVAGDGTRRPLIEGDRVYAGEQLQTGAAGAIAIALSGGGELTLGRDSTLALNEQMLAGNQDDTAANAQDASDAPSDADLTDVQQLQAAIDAGVDPTQVGEATAAGPGAGGAGGAGGVGGGHSFVLLGETAGALNPVIGFPTAGLNSGPEFPEAEPLAAREADSTPSIDIEYEDFEGTIIAGPAIVDEEALSSGSNPESVAEQASGQLIINSPDGVSSVQIMDFGGTWIDVTNGGTVQGQYGILSVDASGNWTYTLTSNTLNHGDPNATGAADQVGESFAVRMFDSDGDVSPTVQLNVLVNDDGPSLAEGEGSLVEAIVDEDETANGISDGDADTHVASGGPGTLSALVNFGADGIGSFALSDSATAIGSLESQGLSSGGAALTYSVIGNVLTALAGGETIFILQVGADGSFTFTLVGPLDHPNPDGDDDELLELPIDFSGVLTAVDGDGDSVGTFNGGSFVVNVEDDVPVLAERGENFQPVGGAVNEDALVGPHNGNDDDPQALVASGSGETGLLGLVDFGADGSGDFSLVGTAQAQAILEAQGLESGGQPLVYSVEKAFDLDGNLASTTLTAAAAGSVGGYPVFSLVVSANGDFTFTLRGPLDHPVADGNDDELWGSGDNLGIDFTQLLTATDGDGDPLSIPQGASGLFVVNVEDDVPVLVRGGQIEGNTHVDEDSLAPNGIDDGDGVGAVANGSLSGLVSFGADGPGGFSLLADTDDLPDLTSNGNEVEYDVVGDTLTAFVAGASGYPVFTFTLNSDGNYTFTLKGQIDHPDNDGNDDTDILQVDLSSIVQATDGDGDSVVLHNSVIINVEDDVPDARDNQASTTENTLPPFNLTLIIDSSGSMDDMVSADLDGDGSLENATRLDVAKAALINLINSYVALGVPLNFKIIDFDSGASNVYEGTSAAEAKDAITSLTAGGNTNYDAALDLARDELEDDLGDPALDGYVNRVYFLSDGAPFPSSNDAPAGWQSFVDNNGIDVIAVGIQIPAGGNAENELGEVANDGDTVIIVQDPNELSAALAETVPDPLEGNVLTDAGPGGPGDVDLSGADSPLRLTQFSFIKQAGAEPEVIIVPRGGRASTVTPAGGILTMFSDGHWTYVAPDNVTENIDEIFTYTIVDADGDPDTATLTISVEDGVPLAVNDTASMTEDTDKVSGNVITNDTVGTDSPGAVHFASTTGTYGSLVFNPSGGWTYDLQNSNPAVQGLGVGESLTEIFQYTLTDADGDTSPASLTITITGKDDGVDIQGLNGNDETVRENDLVDGSSPNSGALVQSGTFTVVAPDGLQGLTVHGISVVSGGVVNTFPQPVTTALGNTLTITGFNQLNGVVSYSYTLVDNASHSIGGGENSIQESFVVQATDDDGDTHIASLDVTIIDDVPDAVSDSNASTASESLLTLTGNVLANDVQGADRVTGGPITAVTLTGTYGTLELNANGSYTYTLNPADPQFVALGGGGTGTETFTYTHTDADGDSDTARLVLKIRNNDGDVTINGLDIQGQEETLYENDLSQGSSPSAAALTQMGTFTILAADGIQAFSLNGANYTLAQLQNSGTTNLLVDSPAGVLRITGYSGTSTGGTVSYSYVLDTRIAHANAGGENSVLESFSIKVTDVDGDSDTDSLDIRIVDDVPDAVSDTNVSTASESLLTLTGNVLSNDVQGADRVAGGPITATTLTGTYGTLVLNANGSYTYTLNPADPQFVALGGGGTGTETFTYTHKDADGDADTAQLVLNIRNNDGDVTINGLDIQGQEETLYENDLSQGSSPSAAALTQTGTFTISAADGIQAFSLNGANYTLAQLQNSGTTNLLVDSPAGVLRITGYTGTSTGGTVSYSYVLDTRIAHANAGGENSVLETFSVKVTDVDGDSDIDNLDIRIVDDVPNAIDDSNVSTASESLLTLTGNVLSNDVQGADRVAGGPITAVTLTGTYGTLVLNANGTYTYTLDVADPQFIALGGGGTGTETFTYSHTDADGDADTAQLVLNIRNNDGDVTINGLDIQGQEETLYENDLSQGSSPNAGALTQTGTFTIAAADGIQTFSLNGANYTLAQLQNSGTTNLLVDSPAGVLRITGYSGTSTGGTVSYSYVLDTRIAHANAGGENSVLESFSIKVTDVDGDSDTDSLDIRIVDDVPDAVNDSNASTASESLLTLTGNVLTNDTQGADRVAGGPITATTLTGTYGTLVLNANGSYTYTLNPADPQFVALPGGATGTETFTYTHTDADGDADTAQLVLNVRNDDQGVTINGLNVQGQEEVVNEDDLPAGSSPNASALTQTGTFDIVAGDGIQTFSVNGSNFTLAQLQNSGTSNLVIDSPAGVLRITGFSGSATGGTVSYSYVLDSRVAHANGAGENTVLESFAIQVKDTDGDSDTESLDILIIDDVPAAVDQTVSQQATQSTNTNLLLILDVSGSMDDDAGFGGYTRLEAAKQALLELLEQYDALGNVKVCLVTFASSATIETGWVDIATAKAELLGLSAGGLTNYEDALVDATTAFAQSGKLTGAQNVAYFLSDGVPNPSSSGINGTEEAAWINFLNGSNNSGPDSGDINAFALGMGPDVSASALNPVAYNGVTNENTFATIVDDFGQLANTLTATAQASPINGSLVTGGTFGADGGYVLSISVNGVIYTYNPAAGGSISVSGNPNNGTFDTSTNTLTVTMGANGSFAVDMDSGVFTYSLPVSVGSAVNQSIGYVLQDNDGDTASANLNVNISPANGPTIIRDDRVITNAPTVSGNDPILIPKWALLANDTSPSNMLLAITAIGAALDGTLAPLDASASLTFSDNDSDGGSFQYTAGGDTALVEVLRDLDGDLNGSYRHDILIGRGDNSDTINGRDGDDILVGLGGADELNGGEGNDILNGGAGNDTLNGGNGNDTASYIDATSAVTVSVNGNNQVTGGAGTDSLSNMENLIGSSYGDTLTGDGNANILSGLAGDDTLIGNGGADVLIGGAGNDTMSGGAGKDVFLWNSSDTGTDTILGFTNNYNGNINGDQLNLSQLLMGENTSGGIGNLLSFLDISTTNLAGGAALDTVIKISTTAAATPETSTEQTIVLQDVNLFATYGGTEANVILGMLNDGSLKVDVA